MARLGEHAPEAGRDRRLALAVRGAREEHDMRVRAGRQREAQRRRERLIGLVLGARVAGVDAPAHVGNTAQHRQAEQVADLALAVHTRGELLAPERHEDADEDRGEQRDHAIAQRTGRAGRRGDVRPLDQLQLRPGAGAGRFQFRRPRLQLAHLCGDRRFGRGAGPQRGDLVVDERQRGRRLGALG